MIYITTLQGVQIGNPFSDPNTIYEIEGGVIIAPSPDTVIEIAPNCVLRFKGDIDTTAPLITLVGNNTYIEAGSYQIFRDKVNLGGSFLNAEWPAEWWGAKSDGTDAAPAINRALEQIANTDKQGTLLLADRYEVRDTIYMQPGVAISGTARTFSYSAFPNNSDPDDARPTRGTLVINFNNASAGKWIIDTKDQTNEPLPDYALYVGDTNYDARFGSFYSGCNISDLHIIDKTQNPALAQYVFGGIRLHSMQMGKIENVAIEAHVFIGLALVAKVWSTSLNNVYILALGCTLYLGKSCTTVSAVNVTCHVWGNIIEDHSFCLKKRTDDPSDTRIAPFLQPNTLPPYWDDARMKTCGIIMEEKAHCTFKLCVVEGIDAVICGTDYNAKFISPYIESIHYFFAWLYSSVEYSIPSHRHELIIEDLVSGFETFPSMKTDSNGYKYLEWEDCEPNGSRDAQVKCGHYKFLHTFGTFRGVIKAHNVGRATCWENDCFKTGNNLITWDYPSYLIYVTPGIKQRNFYYDNYKVMVSKAYNPSNQKWEVVESHLEDVEYCRYKRIIIEGSPMESVRYFYDEKNDTVYDPTTDNKAEMDIYKRGLLLGVSKTDTVLSSELFDRELDHFIMTPTANNSFIDYGNMVIGKKFCIEIINGANVIQFKQPLKLHDCVVTFRKKYTSAGIYKHGMTHLLEISGCCVLSFDGSFSLWNYDASLTPPQRPFGELITLVGNRHVKLTIRLMNTSSTMNNYFSQASNFITNSGSFTPGFDLDVELL